MIERLLVGAVGEIVALQPVIGGGEPEPAFAVARQPFHRAAEMLLGEAVIALAIVPLAEAEIVARIAAEQRILDRQVGVDGLRAAGDVADWRAAACPRSSPTNRSEGFSRPSGPRTSTRRARSDTRSRQGRAQNDACNSPVRRTTGVTQHTHIGEPDEFPPGDDRKNALRERLRLGGGRSELTRRARPTI